MMSFDHDFWRPQVMGVLNVTPDSFSDGGRNALKTKALLHARQMIHDGADIIDIGGESTRPGAEPVPLQEELDRVMPVLEMLVQEFDTLISVDTRHTAVMKEAIARGAGMINDVNALQDDGAIALAAETHIPVCLMHMLGQPKTMQMSPNYGDVIQEIYQFLSDRKQACIAGGIDPQRIILDPGFGFGKRFEHNVQLLRELAALKSLECPLLVGMSRKSMIGLMLGGAPVDERLYGSISAAVIALMNGASILRVHDVAETVQALAVYQHVYSERVTTH